VQLASFGGWTGPRRADGTHVELPLHRLGTPAANLLPVIVEGNTRKDGMVAVRAGADRLVVASDEAPSGARRLLCVRPQHLTLAAEHGYSNRIGGRLRSCNNFALFSNFKWVRRASCSTHSVSPHIFECANRAAATSNRLVYPGRLGAEESPGSTGRSGG